MYHPERRCVPQHATELETIMPDTRPPVAHANSNYSFKENVIDIIDLTGFGVRDDDIFNELRRLKDVERRVAELEQLIASAI